MVWSVKDRAVKLQQRWRVLSNLEPANRTRLLRQFAPSLGSLLRTYLFIVVMGGLYATSVESAGTWLTSRLPLPILAVLMRIGQLSLVSALLCSAKQWNSSCQQLGVCPSCGYQSSLEATTCPECGGAIIKAVEHDAAK